MKTDTLARVGLLIPESWRPAHLVYARLTGFFWLPCPLCGTETGGHEWRDIGGKTSSIPCGPPGHFIGICPSCTRAGRGG